MMVLFSSPVLNSQSNIYEFKVQDIKGDIFDFGTLRGKKIMIVNTASECGLTPQYEKLQALYEKYKDKNFIIIGFPSSNFLNQEPGNDDDIAQFCRKNYGVTFPMMSKIDVIGRKKAPIYKWLTSKKLNGTKNVTIVWNFQKILVDESGKVVDYFIPTTLPDDEKIIAWIEGK
ncbi:MAG: glutathione peroxidase [Saprospiraceae bacterium]